MNRFDIALGKTPPPYVPEEKPLSKDKEAKKIQSSAQRDSIIPEAQRSEIISQYLRTAEGRSRLAASMSHPIRLRLDHNSLARRILHVDELPELAVPYYDKVPGRSAFVTGENGQDIVELPRGDHFMLPIFEISSTNQIALRDIREQRFHLIERAQDLAVQNLRIREEACLLGIMDYIAEHDSQRNVRVTNVTLDSFRSAMRLIGYEEGDPEVNFQDITITMNALTYAGIRHRTELFDETRGEGLFVEGIRAMILGVQIHICRRIPDQQIFFTARPSLVGQLAIRQDITVLSADDPVARTLGWMFMESIGIGICDPNRIARIVIS